MIRKNTLASTNHRGMNSFRAIKRPKYIAFIKILINMAGYPSVMIIALMNGTGTKSL